MEFAEENFARRVLWRVPWRGSAARLPRLDGVDGVDEHDEVEREIVADRPADEELERHGERDGRGCRQGPGKDEADDHESGIRQRIDDAVAVIVERDRRGAIALDDERRVLHHLPGGFEPDREHQRRGKGQRPAPANEAEQRIEENAVDDMSERIPIAEMLRVAGAVDGPFPQLDIAAFADRGMPLYGEPERLQRHDGEDEQRADAPGAVAATCDHRGAIIGKASSIPVLGPRRSYRLSAPGLSPLPRNPARPRKGDDAAKPVA